LLSSTASVASEGDDDVDEEELIHRHSPEALSGDGDPHRNPASARRCEKLATGAGGDSTREASQDHACATVSDWDRRCDTDGQKRDREDGRSTEGGGASITSKNTTAEQPSRRRVVVNARCTEFPARVLRLGDDMCV
jgi:hypothetical protein